MGWLRLEAESPSSGHAIASTASAHGECSAGGHAGGYATRSWVGYFQYELRPILFPPIQRYSRSSPSYSYSVLLIVSCIIDDNLCVNPWPLGRRVKDVQAGAYTGVASARPCYYEKTAKVSWSNAALCCNEFAGPYISPDNYRLPCRSGLRFIQCVLDTLFGVSQRCWTSQKWVLTTTITIPSRLSNVNPDFYSPRSLKLSDVF